MEYLLTENRNDVVACTNLVPLPPTCPPNLCTTYSDCPTKSICTELYDM